ncbi:uncharacterized protein [Malus domestica]|uniref:uncharacterized protein n=1 Tax=Malus domestica TaxID=3750 RepID=UPI0039766C89
MLAVATSNNLRATPPLEPSSQAIHYSIHPVNTQNEKDEDEERRRRDDEARMARDSHSHQVIQVVAQICRPTRSENLDKSRQQRGEEMLDDYFVHNSAFPDTYFKRRFRMERHLFNKIMIPVCNHDSYFVQKKDACGAMGLIPEQKLTAVLRCLRLEQLQTKWMR